MRRGIFYNRLVGEGKNHRLKIPKPWQVETPATLRLPEINIPCLLPECDYRQINRFACCNGNTGKGGILVGSEAIIIHCIGAGL